jgi:tetratricopeptide (TPR) repeat protein
MKVASPGWPGDQDEDDEAIERMLGLARGTPTARKPSCPTVEMIQAADAEVLPDDECRAVADHVDGCAVCGPLAAALREWDGPELEDDAHARIARRSGVLSSNAPTTAVRGPLRWLLPIAAVAVLALGLPALLRERAEGPRPSGPPSSESQRPYVLPLEKLAPRMPASLALRGDDSFAAQLEEALRPYEEGDLETAAARLALLARRYPDAASPRLYLGVAALLRGRADEAERSLEEARVLARESWTPDVLWYLAIARERTGHAAEARAALDTLCAGASAYRERACEVLQRWAPERVPAPPS